MVEVKTIEQLLYFIKGNISLSRYDDRFIDNLMGLKEVTTNQAQLFDRILHKYRRQLAKSNILIENVENLPWGVKLIESTPEFTAGYLFIENDTIKFRCPFNRNFINKFRGVEMNNFVWNKTEKYYETAYSIHQLKILLGVAQAFFPNLAMCDTTTRLLEPLLEYAHIKHWTPTLVRANGNLMISATNEYLNDAIADIELNTTPATLALLSTCGITVDESVTEVYNDPKLKFSAEFNPVVERRDIKNIIPWLKELGCDLVLMYGNPAHLYEDSILALLKQNNIQYQDVQLLRARSREEIIRNDNFCVSFRNRNSESGMHYGIVSKSIRIVNSEPITIK